MEYNEFFINKLSDLSIEEKISEINKIKVLLHELSPFKNEPVDCVLWVKNTEVFANDYNPNSVAPPEMELLHISIEQDGYTQPIVSFFDDNKYEVVDGFHRHRVGKEYDDIKCKVNGYLPIVKINDERKDKKDRIASTIRHNRARGKHKVDAMSDIVIELKRRNWSNERICRELGMDLDEVLRLCQITGLAELFSDKDFSASWDVEGFITEDDFKELDDDPAYFENDDISARTVNTSDDKRIFHTYEKWECYKAGFYNTTKEGMTKSQCEYAYKQLLTDLDKFADTLDKIIKEWKFSCEHYLTNSAMNRIAWLGQAALCYAEGIPSTFRSGFSLLTEDEQNKANEVALTYLNKWLLNNGLSEVSMEDAYSGRQSDIY